MKAQGYDFYFDQLLFPVGSDKLEIKHNSNNKTVNLINDGEINILKKEGLQEISVSFLLPNVKYPFAKYLDTFHTADFYIDYLKMYKENKQPFNFIVSRWMASGKLINHTNIRVVLEDYTEKESKDSGYDVTVDVKLKQFDYYCTKLFSYDSSTGTVTAFGAQRESKSSENVSAEYTVKDGDTLFDIAKYYYGDGGASDKIMTANNLTQNPRHAIYPGMILQIP